MYATQVKSRSQTFRDGWRGEQKVKEYLVEQGYEIEDPTDYEDKYEDIDCWMKGASGEFHPVSIKCQHKGAAYNNICLEIASQLTTHKKCELTPHLLNIITNDKEVKTNPEIAFQAIAKLVEAGSWEYTWFPKGKAKYYLIYQGTELGLYKKTHLQNFIQQYGWQRLRTLSAEVRATQGGSYRYCDTLSGYLSRPSLKLYLGRQLKTWQIG